MRHLTPLLLLAATACGWNNLPNQGRTAEREALWDPQGVIAAADALYVPLPHSGRLARIRPDAGATQVDLGAAAVDGIRLAPDGETLVAFLRYTRCAPDDPRDARGADIVEDCPVDAREIRTEVATLRNGAVQRQIDVDVHYNRLTFAEGGRWAMAWFDLDAGDDLTGAGVVDLTSVLVLDLESGEATPVSVGFAAENILFTPDGTQAVVLSRNSVALVDLDGAAPERGTTFPLTLDPDQSVTPVGVDLTPDGAYAMITAFNQDDLFVLRLQPPSVNLVNLSGLPAGMEVFEGVDATDDIADERTLVVHRNNATVDLIDHAPFDLEPIRLDEPVDRILPLDRSAVLWNASGRKDVYLLNIDTTEVIEFRLENPPLGVDLAPTGEFAVARTRAEGQGGSGASGIYDRSPGLEILPLDDRRGRTEPYLLEAAARDLAFSATDTRLDVLVLQEGVDYLYQLDLYTRDDQQVDLPAAPVAIGALPDAGFWVTHRSPLGLISFYDPTTGERSEVAGFGAFGLYEGVPLEDAPTEEE